MAFLRSLQIGFGLRRLLKTLQQVEGHLQEQNLYLKRLADHFAPEPSTVPLVAGEASVDFLNPREASTVMEYIQRTVQDTGREPTEDEVIQFLADEATQALHSHRTGSGL